MKKILCALIISLVMIANHVSADEASKRANIEQILDVTGQVEAFEESLDGLEEFENIDPQVMKPILVDLYAKYFTEEEITEFLAFETSDLGTKVRNLAEEGNFNFSEELSEEEFEKFREYGTSELAQKLLDVFPEIQDEFLASLETVEQ